MPRSPRILFAGAVYHAMSRGNEKQEIFPSGKDYQEFLRILREVACRYNVICHAYCLMPNHYHLVLETPDANLSQAMQQLNGMYGGTYNFHHNRVGHLFQGRYKAVLVQKQHYLLELSRYVVLNPVRGELASLPQGWPWSSFRAAAGLAPRPDFLCVDWIPRIFAEDDPSLAQRRYIDFIMQGGDYSEQTIEQFKSESVIGSPAFLAQYRSEVERAASGNQEISKKSRFADRPNLSRLLNGVIDLSDRDRKIAEAHLRYGYTVAEIARHLRIHRTTASRAIGRAGIRQFTV